MKDEKIIYNKIRKYNLFAVFDYGHKDPIAQMEVKGLEIFSKLKEKNLSFDFSISGEEMGTHHFNVDEILFKSILSLISGDAVLTIEVNFDIDKLKDINKMYKNISQFLTTNNKSFYTFNKDLEFVSFSFRKINVIGLTRTIDN